MNLPSRQECERWDQAQVAVFMFKNKMPECASVVNKLKINGQKLLSLSESDISKFSIIHQPQLQKIVQNIKKNDGSLLDKFRRLKNKPLPSIPARDYGDDNREDDQSSDYDNDTYEDLCEDDSYEPPPSHKEFTPSASLPRGEYLDSCRNRPSRPPKTPLRPNRVSKQLPPEPTQLSDEGDYINPDASHDDDNYVEPEEDPSSNATPHSWNRAGQERSVLQTLIPDCGLNADCYEVPDKEEKFSTFPPSRLCPVPAKQTHSLPPKPSPRMNIRTSPVPAQEPRCDAQYEVCKSDDGSSDKRRGSHPPLPLPKPQLREKSPKPPLKPRPDLKPKEFESRTMPVMKPDQKPPPKALTMEYKRPKIPCPQFTSPKPAERESVAAENGSVNQEKDADVSNKPWYAATCDRRTADDALLRSNKDGAFMVRKSSGQDAQQPYTLVVFYKGRVYNIPIRFLAGTQQYALGREKRGEEYFSSVSHIIENHQKNPLVLIDAQSNTKDATKLCCPVKP